VGWKNTGTVCNQAVFVFSLPPAPRRWGRGEIIDKIKIKAYKTISTKRRDEKRDKQI